MKKVLLFTLLLSGLSGMFPVNAQNGFKQELLAGPSFGMNFSSVSFAPRVKTKLLPGYLGGVTVRWNTEKNIGLQAELNFSQNGWDEVFENAEYKYARTINYLEFPFLTHIYIGSEKARFFINLGPKIGYMLSESTSSNIAGANLEGKETTQHTMPVENRFTWGLCGGPGLELRTGIGVFNLEGRYCYSLGDIYGSRKKDHFPKSSGQVFSVKLAYLIPIF